MAVSLAVKLERDLKALGDPARAAGGKAYLKSELVHFGVTTPELRKATHAIAAALTRDSLLATVDALWAREIHDLRTAAALLLVRRRDLLIAGDAALIERLIRASKTWALVDILAPNVMGPLVEQHASLGRVLDRWATDADFWVRRAALLALLVPLRRGAGDFDRFARYAHAMLDEREFFIRKAIGWILREVGKRRPELVYDWLLPRMSRASAVTWREAVKYLTARQRARLAR